VKGMGATKPAEEGTVSIRHCLFKELKANGLFYGSDALRSPLHFMRNPGEPEF
jgi:carbonyl reductase 1